MRQDMRKLFLAIMTFWSTFDSTARADFIANVSQTN
jgi:hypothetical protein